MDKQTEKEMFEFIGETRTDIKAIKELLKALPCSVHQKKIEQHDASINKAWGAVAVISTIFGFVGWMLAPFVTWFLGKTK